MPTATYAVSLSIGGVSINKTISRTGDHPNPYEVSLPAAFPLSSWVKTDADTAAGNLAGGHGQTNGTYDVYWDGGMRYGVAVTISTNACALEGGTGTDFPATANATVRIAKHVPINTAIDGDAIQILGICTEYADTSASNVSPAHVLFEDASGDDIAEIDLVANQPQVYDVAGGATNPFTGDPITIAKATNGSTSAACTLKIVSLEDSTP